ncbi:MAG: LPS-assembly protein LptD [Alphaproteobacteria bacterium]
MGCRGGWASSLTVLAMAALWIVWPTASGRTQEPIPTDVPALLTADELTFDEELDLATATGNVEISQGERILLADTVTYNRRTGVVTASGNVVLLEPTGEVIFAEFVELADEMREGFVRGFQMLLADDSRLAAVTGRRIGGVQTELNRAVYSPCKECEGREPGSPLWQIKAVRVLHDQRTRDVIYRDARLEILGVPVFYTPYFRHPDPTVKRRTGFLAPQFGGSSDLGTTLQIPFFWAITPDKDLLLNPLITTKESIVGQARYRQRFVDGELSVRGSGTQTERTNNNDQFRGHIDGRTRFDIDDTWRWGTQIRATTDDTYLKRFNISEEDTLTSTAFVEGFRGRNYARAEALYFQGLRNEDVQEEIPVVAPKLDYLFVGEPNDFGGRFSLEANFQALSRADGIDDQRLSFRGGWQAPYFGRLGDIYTLKVTTQADVYNVANSDESIPPQPSVDDGLTGRIFPQLSLLWRYPWARSSAGSRQLIEPIAALFAGPSDANNDDIPNEDSIDNEFDETNLFSSNRFTGKDRVEEGARLAYGLRTGIYGVAGGSVSGQVGQSYQISDDDFPDGSESSGNFSDVVGRIDIRPNRFLNLLYKTRLDKDNFSVRRAEVDMSVGAPALRLNLEYVFFDEDEEFADRQEVFAQLDSRLTDRWSVAVNTRRDLEADDTISYGASLTYVCDCLIMTAQYRRNFTQNRDIDPTQEFFVRIIFKTLGQIQGGQVF